MGIDFLSLSAVLPLSLRGLLFISWGPFWVARVFPGSRFFRFPELRKVQIPELRKIQIPELRKIGDFLALDFSDAKIRIVGKIHFSEMISKPKIGLRKTRTTAARNLLGLGGFLVTGNW